jgi:hypothetical protein
MLTSSPWQDTVGSKLHMRCKGTLEIKVYEKQKYTWCKSAWETNLHEIQKYMRYKSTVSHVLLYLTFLTNRDRTQVSPTYEVFSRIHLFTIYSSMRNEMIFSPGIEQQQLTPDCILPGGRCKYKTYNYMSFVPR